MEITSKQPSLKKDDLKLADSKNLILSKQLLSLFCVNVAKMKTLLEYGPDNNPVGSLHYNTLTIRNNTLIIIKTKSVIILYYQCTNVPIEKKVSRNTKKIVSG